MADKDPKSPATTSNAYDIMSPRWAKMEALLGGTETMRDAGETYLPKHEEETDNAYQARLLYSTLLNMTEQTLDSLSGKPFSEPVKVNDDVPEAIQDRILPDVDMQGNSLDVFAKQWFKEGLAKAFCHVLVDMPRPTPRADGQPRTLADDRQEGIRPYWVLIKPENVIFVRADVIDGVEVLQHVRIVETTTQQVGFAEVMVTRIRVLEPGTVRLYEPDPKLKRNGEPVWNLVDEYTTGLTYIPLVTFYADRSALCLGKPPLIDLADLNIAWWQSASDQRHALTVARFPILACSGASADDSDPIVIGPNKVLYNADPQGKFYYVEHTGAALDAGSKDLENLENQMAGYGAEFLNKAPGDPTATARALDAAEQTSDLASMAVVFEDAMAQVLDITADWLKLPNAEGGTIELVKDYDIVETDQPGLTALQQARTQRDISRKTYLQCLQLRGVLPEDFDAEEDAEELQEEAQTTLGMSNTELDPNAPDDGTDPNNPDNNQPPADKNNPNPKNPDNKGKTQPPAAKKKAPAKKAAAKKSAKNAG